MLQTSFTPTSESLSGSRFSSVSVVNYEHKGDALGMFPLINHMSTILNALNPGMLRWTGYNCTHYKSLPLTAHFLLHSYSPLKAYATQIVSTTVPPCEIGRCKRALHPRRNPSVVQGYL